MKGEVSISVLPGGSCVWLWRILLSRRANAYIRCIYPYRSKGSASRAAYAMAKKLNITITKVETE